MAQKKTAQSKSSTTSKSFDMVAAIDHATGLIVDNQAGRREGVCDVHLEGYEGRLVATYGPKKEIKDLNTGKVIGTLTRPEFGRRYEGQINGEDYIAMQVSQYEIYLWPKADLEGLGFEVRQPKTFAERRSAAKARVAQRNTKAA